MLLSEYDIIYITQKAIKGCALAKHLACHLIPDYHPMRPKFLDKDILTLLNENGGDLDNNKWVMFFMALLIHWGMELG